MSNVDVMMEVLGAETFLCFNTEDDLRTYIKFHMEKFNGLRPGAVCVSARLLNELTPPTVQEIAKEYEQLSVLWNGTLLVVNAFLEVPSIRVVPPEATIQ